MSTALALTVDVPGIPVPQGSMKSLGRRRMVHDNADLLHPWRDAVTWRIRAAALNAGHTEPWDCPVEVRAVFRLPRPPSIARRRWAPDRKPDLDKLLRAVLDALTGSGVVVDDARVTDVWTRKRYGADPGLTLHIAPIAPPEEP